MLRKIKEFKLPELEEKVLKLWDEKNVFEESLKKRQKGKTFRFYEGPPYANGLPAIHHVLARIFKDIMLRYKSMQGYSVPRRAGWDTHGLPIELAAEKELGIKAKSEIEIVGVAKFNQKAKEVVTRYKSAWEKFTRRIGYWLDLKNGYLTYENSYIESLWWIFKRISDRGYLKEFRKVVPYCPRCETPLSSHEMGMPGVYNLTEDPSVYIKFKLKDADNEYLLIWTTTPWTLPANIAVALDPTLTYTKYKIGREYLWSHNPPPKLSSEAEVAEKLSGKQLIGRGYQPLYEVQGYNPRPTDHQVVAADFVKADEGTGLIHLSPTFGAEEFNLMGRDDLPVTLNDQGVMVNGLPGAGKFFKEADPEIMDDLEKRGLVYLNTKVKHEYPFCWRCSSPIIYFARKGWFLEVSRLRKELVRENEKINWIPSYIKGGRFGEWIKNAEDWAVSRERYWGTPLPIWRCEKSHLQVIGSLEELDKYAYAKNKFFVLRHGEAEHNLKGMLASGPEDNGRISHLTEKGRREAEAAAKKLAGKKIDVIFTSPYKRAMETAEIIARSIKAEVMSDNRLREIDAGEFNWKTIEEYHGFFTGPLERFIKAPQGGETWAEVRRRVFGFILDVNGRYENKNILIVGHNGPNWLLDLAVRQLKDEDIFGLPGFAVGEWREINLKSLPYTEEGEVDLHRPYVDQIYLKCKKCKGEMRRVPDVADVWYDSGAMPLASVHYPFENKKEVDSGALYPADFIAEAVDQTRGWFYTLLTIGVLLGKGTSYLNAISLGLINDKYGQKMSKSRGNIVEPNEVINKYGVDAIRWYFYTVNPPGEPKDFDEADVQLVLRQFFLILYNSFKFYEMAHAMDLAHSVDSTGSPRARSHALDRWILSRLHQTIQETTANLEKYEIGAAARIIEVLVDDMSRWYIRRSRRRLEMQETLGVVLLEISKMIAPFAPFFGDMLYLSTTRLGGMGGLNSVHLEDWPKANAGLIDEGLVQKMKKVRELAASALAERAAAGIKVRQPLGELKIKATELKNEPELMEILKEEVNVKEVIVDGALAREVELNTEISGALKEEGSVREFVRMIQGLRREAGLMPQDKINLYIHAPAFAETLEKHVKALGEEVNAAEIFFRKSEKFDAELSTKIEGQEIWIGLRKA
ncbi:MAG: class I tRNA ligase family protein [Candidatus Colwellbacteria bacterium]